MLHSSFSSTYHSLPNSIKNLVNRIVEELHPEEVILFGSRARGDHRENSDFDIAVRTQSQVPEGWSRIQVALAEEPITLYSVDLLDFSCLNDEYKKRIKFEGKILYVR